MANLSITASSVGLTTKTRTETIQVGESVTPGVIVYLSTTDSKWYKSDASVTAAQTAQTAFVLTPASTNGYAVIVRESRAKIAIGATVSKGVMYYASSTAGLICLFSDLTTGDGVIELGRASSTSEIDINITPTGIVL